LRAAVFALLALTPTAAMSFEVPETAFEVYHTENGREVSESTTTVPLSFDDQTCWNWWIRSVENTGEVTFTEKLMMPTAPESWGDPDEIPEGQIGKLILEDGGKIGISTRNATLDDGWFGHAGASCRAIPWAITSSRSRSRARWSTASSSKWSRRGQR
jgi:hypothetical protein